MQTEPVVVPVEADVTKAQSAIEALGQSARSARGAGAADPASGATAAAGASALGPAGDPNSITSLRGVLREMAVLEGVLQRLVTAFDKTTKAAEAAGGGGGGGGSGGGPTVPPVLPPPQPGRPGGRPLIPGLDLYNMMRGLIGGSLGLVGFGTGMGSAFSELGQWIQQSENLGVEIAYGTMGVGGNARAYAAAEGFLTSPTRRSTPVMPLDLARGMGVMGRAGMRFSGPEAEMAGELGLYGFGSPAAGYSLAAQSYQTLRSQQVPELLTTLVQLGKEQNVTANQMLQQWAGLRSIAGARGGQYERNDSELLGLANLSAQLTGLPNQAGVGQGGVDIAQRLSTFGAEGGIEQAIVMRAYMRSTGKSWPTTPEGLVDFIRWRQDPAHYMEIAGAIRSGVGPAVGALMLSSGGRTPIRPFEALMAGGHVPHADHLLSGEQSGQVLDRLTGLLDTVGGKQLGIDEGRARSQSRPSTLTTIEQKVQDYFKDRRGALVVAEGVAGVAGLAVTGAAARGLGRMLIGGGTAGGVAKVGLLQSVRAVLPALLGAGLVLKDTYDAIMGGDDENALEMAVGVAGAIAGGVMGIPAGPAGIVGGALAGYGMGHTAADAAGLIWRTFGGTPAQASIPPTAAQPGGGRHFPGGGFDAGGMNPDFKHRLDLLIKDVEAHGGHLRITSGYRNYEHQVRLWNAAVKKYGSEAAAAAHVGRPGGSRHQWGLAADLEGDRELAGQLAERYGLYRPGMPGPHHRKGMAREPWHFEPLPGSVQPGADPRDIASEIPFIPEAEGGGELHVYIHADPHLAVTTAAPPGIVVRRGN